jgi:hypothetical protein
MTGETSPLPPGDYAIVEVLGHRTLVGRVTEVERFGTKLMSIEPLFNGELLTAVLIGGGSIYQFTPCTPEVAGARQPKQLWQLPNSIAVTLPAAALPSPEALEDMEEGWDPPSFLSGGDDDAE